MRHYETTFVLRPNLGQDQFTEIIDRTCKIIEDHGGTVINIDRWGMRKLAYEIKKEVQGYYVNLNYAAPGSTIIEVERVFRLDDRLLRYLTIKLADAIDAEGIARAKNSFTDQTEETTSAGEEEKAPASESAATSEGQTDQNQPSAEEPAENE